MRSAVVAFVIAFAVVIFLVGASAIGGRRVITTSFGHGSNGRGDMSETKTLSPTVTDFHAVHTNGPINVNITSGPTASLKFEARADVLPLLTSEVKDGVLTIGMNDTGKNDIGDITATIVTPKLDDVMLNGSGNVDVQGVKATDFNGTINGSGNLTMSGAADSTTIKLEGSGNIVAKDLVSQSAKVILSGSGNVEVNASKKLDANLSGSGNIQYAGNPANLTRQISGSGNVEPED
jgi:hypothetical protein